MTDKNSFLKRITAISFIFLANVVLLAMLAFPHHHHGDAICFNQSHGIPHQEHKGCDSTCSHDHGEEPPVNSQNRDHSSCMVEEWVLTNGETSQKHEFHCHCISCSDHLYTTVPNIFISCEEPPVKLTGLAFRRKPFVTNYEQTFVNRLHGLRAPPFS